MPLLQCKDSKVVPLLTPNWNVSPQSITLYLTSKEKASFSSKEEVSQNFHKKEVGKES